MITTSRPGVDEYAPAFARYVARITEDEDILAARHHLEVLETRYTG